MHGSFGPSSSCFCSSIHMKVFASGVMQLYYRFTVNYTVKCTSNSVIFTMQFVVKFLHLLTSAEIVLHGLVRPKTSSRKSHNPFIDLFFAELFNKWSEKCPIMVTVHGRSKTCFSGSLVVPESGPPNAKSGPPNANSGPRDLLVARSGLGSHEIGLLVT